jgi:hypothetical protein
LMVNLRACGSLGGSLRNNAAPDDLSNFAGSQLLAGAHSALRHSPSRGRGHLNPAAVFGSQILGSIRQQSGVMTSNKDGLLEISVPDTAALREAVARYGDGFQAVETGEMFALLERKRAGWFRPRTLFLLLAALIQTPVDLGDATHAKELPGIDPSVRRIRIRVAKSVE